MDDRDEIQVDEFVRIRTRSKNCHAIFLCFATSLLLYNVWAITNHMMVVSARTRWLTLTQAGLKVAAHHASYRPAESPPEAVAS